MKGSWLSAADWKLIQTSIPVVCVDVLPVRFSPSPQEDPRAVGLILRKTTQGRKWCLIGGRLLYGELLSEAIRRQVREALGRRVEIYIRPGQQPLYIAQYSPSGRKPFAQDGRQHSVGLTYTLELQGTPTPSGEAILFKWFETTKLPRRKQFGFSQDMVLRTCLRLLKNRRVLRQES
jgi:ADP-ribose pyrophosphatase YjhB (NUDIX family)